MQTQPRLVGKDLSSSPLWNRPSGFPPILMKSTLVQTPIPRVLELGISFLLFYSSVLVPVFQQHQRLCFQRGKICAFNIFLVLE